MKNLSIVIAAYRAEGTIGRTLDALRVVAGIDRAEIIVVDDGSDDDTATRAARSDVVVLRVPHRGRAAALNRGIAAATGEVIFITDADCLVPRDWLDVLLAKLGDFDGVGGNLLPGRPTVVELAKVLRYVEEFEYGRELVGAYEGVCLNGNNMAVRRAALQSVGGFDESFIHGADADLTRRLLAEGCRLKRTTRAPVTHLKIDTLRSFLRTMWTRGSTVRFGMKSGDENAATLARALFASPWKHLFVDLTRVPRLRVFGPDATGWHGWLAPAVNFLGGIATGLGRIHFYRRFKREAR